VVIIKTKVVVRFDMARLLSDIAWEIFRNWENISTHAAPYLNAMQRMGSVDEHYGADSGKSVVLYFLANATGWRGEKARAIKKELKAMCK